MMFYNFHFLDSGRERVLVSASFGLSPRKLLINKSLKLYFKGGNCFPHS
jgi:hypothetical protein